MSEPREPYTVRAIRPDRAVDTLQRLPYFIGVSGHTVGATGLSMHVVVIPPGARAEPHIHLGYETGIYVIEGRVETRFGEGLDAIDRQRGGRLPVRAARRAARGDQPERHRAGARDRRAQRPRRAGQGGAVSTLTCARARAHHHGSEYVFTLVKLLQASCTPSL